MGWQWFRHDPLGAWEFGPIWENFVHTSIFARLYYPCNGKLTYDHRFRQYDLDLAVLDGEGELTWYIEVKEAAQTARSLEKNLHRIGADGVYLAEALRPGSRLYDARRKARAIVKATPQFFSLMALDRSVLCEHGSPTLYERHFKVVQDGSTGFALKPVEPPARPLHWPPPAQDPTTNKVPVGSSI